MRRSQFTKLIKLSRKICRFSHALCVTLNRLVTFTGRAFTRVLADLRVGHPAFVLCAFCAFFSLRGNSIRERCADPSQRFTNMNN